MNANTEYTAAEFNRDTCQPTGKVETYFAGSMAAAVESLLYTRRIANGSAYVGPSGQCVYAGSLAYAIVPVKVRKGQRR